MGSGIGAVAAVLAGALFVLVHVHICSMAVILYKNHNHLDSSEFKAKYGDSLTQGLSLDGSFCGTYWNVIQLTRWSATSVILVVLRDYCSLQLMILLALSMMIQILVLATYPLKTKSDNWNLLFNEIMVSAYLYVLLSLTDFNP